MVKLYRDFTSQDEIDREYNPDLTLTDPAGFASIIAQRAVLSAEAAKTLTRTADVSYGPTRLEALDIYPAAKPNAPVCVFIHGGYWFDGRLTRDKYVWIAKGFSAHSITTVIVDYQICPIVTIDEIVRQCRAAIAWVYRNAAGFGGDPERLYVTGNSAGGHLTAMMALTDWPGVYGLPDTIIKGGCPISGLYDLRPFPYSWLQPKIQLNGQEVERNSPLFHVRPGRVPLLISWGARESREFWRQSESFGEAWAGAGNRTELLPQEGVDHFTANAGFGDPDSAFCRRVIEHMASCWPER